LNNPFTEFIRPFCDLSHNEFAFVKQFQKAMKQPSDNEISKIANHESNGLFEKMIFEQNKEKFKGLTTENYKCLKWTSSHTRQIKQRM